MEVDMEELEIPLQKQKISGGRRATEGVSTARDQSKDTNTFEEKIEAVTEISGVVESPGILLDNLTEEVQNASIDVVESRNDVVGNNKLCSVFHAHQLFDEMLIRAVRFCGVGVVVNDVLCYGLENFPSIGVMNMVCFDPGIRCSLPCTSNDNLELCSLYFITDQFCYEFKGKDCSHLCSIGTRFVTEKRRDMLAGTIISIKATGSNCNCHYLKVATVRIGVERRNVATGQIIEWWLCVPVVMAVPSAGLVRQIFIQAMEYHWVAHFPWLDCIVCLCCVGAWSSSGADVIFQQKIRAKVCISFPIENARGTTFHNAISTFRCSLLVQVSLCVVPSHSSTELAGQILAKVAWSVIWSPFHKLYDKIYIIADNKKRSRAHYSQLVSSVRYLLLDMDYVNSKAWLANFLSEISTAQDIKVLDCQSSYVSEGVAIVLPCWYVVEILRSYEPNSTLELYLCRHIAAMCKCCFNLGKLNSYKRCTATESVSKALFLSILGHIVGLIMSLTIQSVMGYLTVHTLIKFSKSGCSVFGIIDIVSSSAPHTPARMNVSAGLGYVQECWQRAGNMTLWLYDPGIYTSRIAFLCGLHYTQLQYQVKNRFCGKFEVSDLCTCNSLHVKNPAPLIIYAMDHYNSQFCTAATIHFKGIYKIGRVGAFPPGHFVVGEMCHTFVVKDIKCVEKKTPTGARDHAINWSYSPNYDSVVPNYAEVHLQFSSADDSEKVSACIVENHFGDLTTMDSTACTRVRPSVPHVVTMVVDTEYPSSTSLAPKFQS